MAKRASIELFKPFKISGLELRNRFVRSATWDNTADSSGAVTDDSVAIYTRLGSGGVGLIVTGFAFVSPSGQALPAQYGAHSDDMIPGLRRLVQAAHRGGAKIALQIVHAGINSAYLPAVGREMLAVSKKQDVEASHHELIDAEIEELITDFCTAAVRARKAGFDAVQLHGAHGYLLSQFLSPLYNLRTDRWGGNAEKRRKFHLELVHRVRQTIGNDFPLLIKFGIQDDTEGGLPLSEGLETAKQMVDRGIDAIEVSAGVGRTPVVPRKKNAEFVPYRERAAALKRIVTVPVMIVSGIRSLYMAQSIVNSGDADLISMSRPLIREPGLIARWQRGEEKPSDCVSCFKCHSKNKESVQCRKEQGLVKKT
jgi:2,4-dienoyl-CoA reductase-like NADH-dependent reductase (Old Yellow Enzyme family)